jgi:hemolysin III
MNKTPVEILKTAAGKVEPFQTHGEEIANSILHGLGVLLGIAGLVLLALRRSGFPAPPATARAVTASCMIYGATVIAMFLASTLYHAMTHRGAKRILRVIDHSAIYLLIAGTYTPICFMALPGVAGRIFFLAEWGLAACGITLYALRVKFIKKAELVIYLLMGWAIAGGLPLLRHTLSRASLVFLLAGGLAYTAGTFFYSRKNARGAHVAWHVFVLAGAILHWFSIWSMAGGF